MSMAPKSPLNDIDSQVDEVLEGQSEEIATKSPLDGTIPQVKENLEALSEEELQRLLEEEITGANRKGVIDFINTKLSE